MRLYRWKMQLQLTMIEVDCQISIKKNGTCFLGPLKTQLLKENEKSGSLSGAAKKMDISYLHVWTIIDEMNRTDKLPLVTKQRVGTNGGGAAISDYGERVLREYKLIEAQIKKSLTRLTSKSTFDFF